MEFFRHSKQGQRWELEGIIVAESEDAIERGEWVRSSKEEWEGKRRCSHRGTVKGSDPWVIEGTIDAAVVTTNDYGRTLAPIGRIQVLEYSRDTVVEQSWKRAEA